MWSVIDIGPINYNHGQFKFPEMLVKSDGTKGHINIAWHKLHSELDDPSSIDPRCKFRYCLADKKYGDNTRVMQQARYNPPQIVPFDFGANIFVTPNRAPDPDEHAK